jgi:DNA polymerase I
VALANNVSSKIRQYVEDTNELEAGLLIGAGYDGEKRLAYLKLYDPASERIRFYYDKSGHKPYCYTKQPLEELQSLKQRPDVIDIIVEEKRDLIADKKILVSKIVTSDPLAIGGAGSGRSIRDSITAYEADIKYYENYIYDKQLQMGTYYSVKSGRLESVPFSPGSSALDALKKSTEDANPLLAEYIQSWALLLTQPQPNFKRAALDIEVYSPEENRLPDAERAEYPVISAALVGSDGRKTVYVLERSEVDRGDWRLPEGVQVRMFRSEGELILSLFEAMLDYPILATFNGDQFDLPYLYNRALKMDIQKEAIPISMGRDSASVKHGLHLDLYRAFNNRSIQVYAFSNRYSDHTLNGIASALLGREKVEYEGGISQLPLASLAYYNFVDADITLELTSFNNELFMRLFATICRISKMPMEDACRLNVSNWIRSLLLYEHRKWNALVPRKDDLEAKGSASSEAVIRGKKYKGGLVIEPLPGVHFNVVVVDFASLYPSIIKVYNLSYETVNCAHQECKTNRIPETDHWVCRQRTGITSLLIGSLRDVRVGYFKNLSRRLGTSKEEKEFYNVISQSLKVFLNASYGVMGFESFALYCLPVAEATAALGRYSITRTIEKAKSVGIEVAYGDTDSLFLKSPKKEQVDELLDWAKKELGIELEIDKVYRYAAFSGRKKNYLGVYTDGSVEVKGLTGKKSNVPEFIKAAFKHVVAVLGEVQSAEDFERARERIRELLRQTYLDLKGRRIPMEQLAFHVMMNKPLEKYTDNTPQHVKAAQILKQRGKEIKSGEIISFVKTSAGTGVKPVEFAKPDDIDVEKYVEYMRGTFDQLLDALGYEFDEILGATKLEDYFFG